MIRERYECADPVATKTDAAVERGECSNCAGIPTGWMLPSPGDCCCAVCRRPLRPPESGDEALR